MRPGGREVEKKVGSALSVTPKNGKFHRKSGLVRNQKKKVPIVPSASVPESRSFWICAAHGMVGSTSRAFLQSISSQ